MFDSSDRNKKRFFGISSKADFVLFLVTLGLNFIALRVVKRFREAYE